MYVTRTLSRFLADPEAITETPPDGPGSGFLVVLDGAAEQESTFCCGLCLDRSVCSLPFPQNRQLCVSQDNRSADMLERIAVCISRVSNILCMVFNLPSCDDIPLEISKPPPDYAVFVPVTGEPLSSGSYYVVKVDGKHAGKVSTCSKEADVRKCCFCFCSVPSHVKPSAFVHGDVYQQMQVRQHHHGFSAAAVASDGIPPKYLMKKGWTVDAMAKPEYPLLDDAQGVDSALRDQMPDIGSVSVVVGRWYVPFLFVKADGKRRLKDQVRKSMFYKMTMEQSWEQIFSRENTSHLHGTESSSTKQAAEVDVTATVCRFTALLGETTAVQEGCPEMDSGAMWFRPAVAVERTWCCGRSTLLRGVGLDMVLWERMKFELERGGRWVVPDGNGDEERIERTERRNDGLGHWSKFGCYLLVERFVLRRMDGTVALTCEFRHIDKIRAKWE